MDSQTSSRERTPLLKKQRSINCWSFFHSTAIRRVILDGTFTYETCTKGACLVPIVKKWLHVSGFVRYQYKFRNSHNTIDQAWNDGDISDMPGA